MLVKVILLVAVFVLVSESKADKDESQVAKRFFRRSALRSHYLWPNGIVFYKLHRNLDRAGRNRLRKAMRRISAKTCIRFQRRRREPNYVLMQYDMAEGACKSAVGFKGGEQGLWISNPEGVRGGYCRVGSVIHEIGHTLGFFHEQSRPDRDRYVRINLDNIAPKYKWAKHNFDKADRRFVDSRGEPYDYGSLMHYGKYGFASPGKPVVEPLDPNAKIGQRNGLSGLDIRQLKLMYNCR